MASACAGLGQTQSEPMDRPTMQGTNVVKMHATVAAVDQKTRKVTLKDDQGNTVSFTAGPEVKNLAQVDVGDLVVAEYIETVSIRVVAAGEAEVGAAGGAVVAKAEPGQKPAGGVAGGVTVVAELMAIDKKNETATLKLPDGQSKTIKVREPKNLDRVKIGDKVIITYAEAMAITVEEK
jgi:hypothetical protein